MKIEVVMPKMGESLQEGTIIRWIKKEGEKVERDEMILEISTDKVDTEVPAPNSGVLSKIIAQENETVEVGTVIAILDTEGVEGASSKEEPAKEAKAVEPAKETKAEEPKKEEPKQDTQSAGSDDAVEVVMPKMGESLQEGTIIKWLKAVGEKVERDEMILEISTDKVDTEVPSPVSGVIAEIIAEEGETVEVGSVIAKISSSGKTSATKPAETQQKESAPAKESKTAQAEAKSQESNSITIPAEGTKEIPARKGDKFFSPLVRNIATDKGVTLEELEQIEGSGADGRVTKNDLMSYLESRKDAPKTAAKPAAKTEEAPKTESKPEVKAEKPAVSTPSIPAKPASVSFPDGADTEIIPMDRIRQIIADHMVYSKHTSAHVTSVSEADVTNIVNLRNKYKDQFQQREGFKLTYTPFFALAAAEAMKQFPMVNVSVDGKNIIKHRRLHLGMATALPDGNLIVPVIKNADIMNVTGLARSINDLAFRARNKKLSPDDIQGGTFTVTNVGTFGTLFGTPVINQPQCGIMGVGAIKKRPIVKEVEGNDLILVRQMMYVSLTYDHRVVDGMLAGQWLAAAVRALENMNENTVSI